MATATIYANDGAGCSINAYAADPAYHDARAGARSSADAVSHYWNVGQDYNIIDAGDYICFSPWFGFDTSAVTGSVESGSLSIYRQDDGSKDDDDPFTLYVRVPSAEPDTAAGDGRPDFISAQPLWGSVASADFGTGAYEVIDNTSYIGYLFGDTFWLNLSASTWEDGTPPTGSGWASLWNWSEEGTDKDPKLTVVHGDRPEVPTIVTPAEGAYSGESLSLTANAHDPNANNVHFHWEYRLNDAGAWTACANSPSASSTHGTDITIDFDMGAVSSVGDIVNLRCLSDDGTNQSIAYAYVDLAYTTQTGFALYRTGGDDLIDDPVSGLIISRAVSQPSTLTFAVDNFDAGEADIADGDELVLVLPYESGGGSYTWRGFVTEKKVSAIMEVTAQDIAYRFARLIVTRTLTDKTVGTIVKAIVEDPTGSEATGITALCAEVDDPATPGTFLAVADFAGQNRTVLDWLNEFSDWTGAQWYCYHDGTSWRFRWFVPSENTSALNAKDNIEYGAEDASNARILNSATVTVTRDRREYVNRVYYWWFDDPDWVLGSVETAAVTGDSEAPIETILSTKPIDTTGAAMLAQAYLDAYSVTRVTVENLQLFGIRELDLDSDITLTLASRDITATAYPVAKIEYRPLDQGHVTSISLGDPALDVQRSVDRLVRRIQDVTAEVRA